jgi:secondary thiamine-phosphate synthase enzyme
MTIRQHFETLTLRTAGPGFSDITGTVARSLAALGVGDGLVTLFIRHTSASLTIQENADPAVLADLAAALDRLAPRGAPYRHSSEGSDDMPAHIRTMLTATSLAIPVRDGRMLLGTWQGVYLVEHRDRPREREVIMHFIGEFARAG